MLNRLVRKLGYELRSMQDWDSAWAAQESRARNAEAEVESLRAQNTAAQNALAQLQDSFDNLNERFDEANRLLANASGAASNLARENKALRSLYRQASATNLDLRRKFEAELTDEALGADEEQNSAEPDMWVTLNPGFSEARENAAQQGSLVFVHIPKSAGTTFNAITYEIANHLGLRQLRLHGAPVFAGLESLSGVIPAKGAIVSGHAAYCPSLANKGMNYVTLIRDPCVRVVSELLYTGIYKDLEGLIEDIELGSILLHQSGVVDNVATRMIVGKPASEPLDAADVARAKRILTKDFFLYGSVGRFEEFVEALLLKANFPGIYYRSENVGRWQRIEKEHSARLRELLEPTIALDAELYEWVRDTEIETYAEVAYEAMVTRDLNNASTLCLNAAGAGKIGSDMLEGEVTEIDLSESTQHQKLFDVSIYA